MDFTGSSRAAAGDVWHKKSGSSDTFRSVLSPCLLPGCFVLTQVSGNPLPSHKSRMPYGSTEWEQSVQECGTNSGDGKLNWNGHEGATQSQLLTDGQMSLPVVQQQNG